MLEVYDVLLPQDLQFYFLPLLLSLGVVGVLLKEIQVLLAFQLLLEIQVVRYLVFDFNQV